jgi:transposase
MVEHMLQHDGLRTLEVLTGSGRRRWTDEQKARIVAESFAPGAVVAEVARRHEIRPQHLTSWRAAARNGLLALPAGDHVGFARVVVSDCGQALAGAGLEVRIGPAVIPVERGTDLTLLRTVVKALAEFA